MHSTISWHLRAIGSATPPKNMAPAVERGLITRQQVRNARMSGPARKFVEEVLRRVA